MIETIRCGRRLLNLAGCIGAVLAWSASAEAPQCQRLFQLQQERDTCETLLGLYGAKPDDELRDQVSRQVHGLSYREADEKRRLQQEGAKQPYQSRQRTNDDRCGMLFSTDQERDLCRWLGVFSSQQGRTDEELRHNVRDEMDRMARDPEYKEHVLTALSRSSGSEEYARQLQEMEEAKQKKAKEAEQRAERQRLEAEKRAEKQRIAAANALDSTLRSGRVGFAPISWKLGGFGTVLIASFWLQNNTNSRAKDFQITCRTFGESDSELSKVTQTLYSALEPRQRRSFELNMGPVHSQSAKASCALLEPK